MKDLKHFLADKENVSYVDLSKLARIGDDEAILIAGFIENSKTLTILNLSHNYIDNKGAIVISQALKNNSSLKVLYLDNNSIGNEGAEAISRALKVNSSLSRLYLGGNGITNIGVLAIALECNSSLTILDLGGNDRYLGSKRDIISFAKALENNNFLRTLYLNNHGLCDEEAKAIGNALEINNSLVYLYLDNNGIGDEGAEAIGNALKTNTSLVYLDLSHNKIGNSGAKAIGNALKVNNSLVQLYLNDNKIDSETAGVISKAFENNNTLTVLYISYQMLHKNNLKYFYNKKNSSFVDLTEWNSIFFSQVVKELKEKHHTLNQLGLSNQKIRADEVREIVKMLKQNYTITDLNLSNNHIGDDGAKEIAKLLKVNHTITRLDIRKNQIGYDGSRELVQAIQKGCNIVQLDFKDKFYSLSTMYGKNINDNNNIPWIEEKIIIRVLEYNKSLVVKLANFIIQSFSSDEIYIDFCYYSAFKFYQVADKELLTSCLDKLVDDSDDILKRVDKFIAENYFTLAGICKQAYISSTPTIDEQPLPVEVIRLISSYLEPCSLWKVQCTGEDTIEDEY